MTSKGQNKHSATHFFKIITATNLESGNLKIPNGFTQIYSSSMPNPVFLKPPDSTKWEIHWTKNDGDIWFLKGCKEFTSYYSLGHGHLVLFDYKDTSHFEVHIFDNKNTLEIEYPMIHGSSQDEQKNNPDQMRDNSVEILDEMPPCKKTRGKPPMSHPQPHRKLRSHIGGDVASSSKWQNFPKQVRVEENVGGTSGLVHYTPTVTESSKRATTTFRSKNPYFKVVMKSSYIGGYYLHVPSYFAETYLKKKEGGVVLEVLDGRSWHCTYDFCKIWNGWKQFVLDNNLKLGAACYFELIKRQPLTFKVLISPLEKLESAQGDGVDLD